MTEKRYKMINTNLKDKDRVYYNIQRNDGFNVCQVFGKHTAREIVDELNALYEETQRLKRKNKRLHRDWDKLYDLCLDKGCTEDEIIKEMER